MKKTSEELKKELEQINTDLDWLYKHYPKYRKDKGYWTLNPLPKEIKEQYYYLYSRKKNLQTNINQAKMKELNH